MNKVRPNRNQAQNPDLFSTASGGSAPTRVLLFLKALKIREKNEKSVHLDCERMNKP